MSLIETAYESTNDPELEIILNFLQKEHTDLLKAIKSNEIVTFRASHLQLPFDKLSIQRFWGNYVASQLTEGEGVCSVTGQHGSIMRIMPTQISLFGQACPIASFNKTAFTSRGKSQLANSPLSPEAAISTSQVLQYLVKTNAHRKVLAYDDKVLFNNQLAVYWLKEEEELEDNLQTEDVLGALLEDDPEDDGTPPPDIIQMERFISLPYAEVKHQKQALNLPKNKFHLAILTPNKSRLVVREWIEEDIEKVWANLARFYFAAKIVHPSGVQSWTPPIPAIIDALRPEKSRSASVNPNLMRNLLRTAYTGVPLSQGHGLLTTAVQRFRVPDKATNNAKEKRRQENRRMALVAAMKLVLTHGNEEEAKVMSTLDLTRNEPAYLCGRLLAVLEEAQLRASGWKINTTFVDRFYSSASTAPKYILGHLVKLTTTSHMPQIRRKQRGYNKLETLLEDVQSRIDALGGFPETLTMQDMAEFGLGFYSQRASFSASRNQNSPTNKDEGETA